MLMALASYLSQTKLRIGLMVSFYLQLIRYSENMKQQIPFQESKKIYTSKYYLYSFTQKYNEYFLLQKLK
jgi:hypothetical protein